MNEKDNLVNAVQLNKNQKGTTMSVMEMGRILGLKKTDSYWLVHKGFFDVITAGGQMRIVRKSFEDWYDRQVKYHKIDGLPPGKKLKETSYDIHDISELLGICIDWSYEVMEQTKLPYIIVDFVKRWEKEPFDKWYNSQTRYRSRTERESEQALIDLSMSLPEISFLLGIHRNCCYNIVYRQANHEFFEIITVGDHKRVLKKSFLKWYVNQSRYTMKYDTIEEAQKAKAERILSNTVQKATEPGKVQKQERPSRLSQESSNPYYYSMNDIERILKKNRNIILKMIRQNLFPTISVAGSYRIPKLEFDRWLIETKEKELNTKESEDN